MRKRILKLGLVLLLALTVGACARLQMNSFKGPGWYQVKPTDTLYSIAWRYDLDYRDLARWNGIAEPYAIHPGQHLQLFPPKEVASAADTGRAAPDDNAATRPRPAAGSPARRPPARVVVKPLEPEYSKVLRWSWPVDGALLKRFSLKQLDRHGIDIAGKIGQPVRAAEGGKVVYSGNGLSGYGNLVIIKHNDLFLSAYAHNRRLKAKEGQIVRRGEVIAFLGQGRDGVARLHFQIRKNGKPVDPLKYLPPRQETR
jgi:lipoprotein NlpD